MQLKNVAAAVIAGVMLLASSISWAESFQSFGDYDVHFNAFTTDFLSPQVAQTYKIQRSKNRALLNISILKKVLGTPGESVTGVVRATARNLSGQLRSLDVRKVVDGPATYYLSTFSVNNEETLDFEIQVTPQGRDAPYVVKFRQQFFTN